MLAIVQVNVTILVKALHFFCPFARLHVCTVVVLSYVPSSLVKSMNPGSAATQTGSAVQASWWRIISFIAASFNGSDATP
jgi:hypothetical protein